MSGSTLVVVNPVAGDVDRLVADLHDGIASRDLDADVVVTDDVTHVIESVERAVVDGIDTFAAVGGDGTVHHVVNALPIGEDRRFALTVLPAGTGSDLARTFGLGSDVESCLDRIARRDRYPVDVGWVSGSFGRRRFLNAANAGIAAQSVITAERVSRRLGAIRYTVAFWMTLARFPGAPVDVVVDDHRFSGEALNVVVANGQFFGGGLNVAPRATMEDGRFDVLVFSGARTNAFTVMPRLAFGAHLTHRAVRRYLGATVRIDVPDDWPIEADGELLGRGPVDVGIDHRALDFLV